MTHQISKDYGVLLENQGHTLRGLFIIDDNGILRQITMNDLPVNKLIEALQSILLVIEHRLGVQLTRPCDSCKLFNTRIIMLKVSGWGGVG